ncbi:MAG: hypothetical protein KatS3mg110_0514 [Pirellulaceae bacterium]|nr:MAG: hypothetical protein KatS3mg110_0514 [Pirellulaceae bacterium]
MGTTANEVKRLIRQAGEAAIDSASLSLVEEWVDDFFELAHAADTSHPPLAYDLLSAWYRLWRVKPALVEAVTGIAVPVNRKVDSDFWSVVLKAYDYHRDEQLLRSRLPDLVRMALDVPKPLAWIGELYEFADAVVEQGEEPTEWARDLLEDLDTACLLCAAAEWLSQSIPESLRQQMRLARRALRRQADAFLIIPDFVLSFVKTIDFDHPVHPLLASSADWSVILLEEIVRFRRFAEGDQPISKEAFETVRHLVKAQRERLAVAALTAWLVWQMSLPRAGAMVSLAASTHAPSEAINMNRCRWISPDGQYVALVDLPSQTSIETRMDRLAIRFHRIIAAVGEPVPGSPATELERTMVRFCGLESVVNSEAIANFPLEQLHEAIQRQPSLDLIVSSPTGEEVWELASSPTSETGEGR